MNKEIAYWGQSNKDRQTVEDRDDAIEGILDEIPMNEMPETIEITGFAVPTVHPAFLRGSLLDAALCILDEEYGNSDDTYTEPNEEMKKAEDAFIEVILRNYHCSALEVVKDEVIDTREWIEKHRPDWLGK